MIIDTSALVAILRNERERDLFVDRLTEEGTPAITSVTWTECLMVMLSRLREPGVRALRDLIASERIEIVPVTAELAEAAFAAFRRFGKGRHPAGLNFGDCFSYALADQTGRPLLFKGDDFTKTNVKSALQSR